MSFSNFVIFSLADSGVSRSFETSAFVESEFFATGSPGADSSVYDNSGYYWSYKESDVDDVPSPAAAAVPPVVDSYIASSSIAAFNRLA
jgi:hypothetical protein